LNILENEDTRYNYNIVQELLEKKEEQNNKNEEQNQEQEESQD
jgi:hypothetical protein